MRLRLALAAAVLVVAAAPTVAAAAGSPGTTVPAPAGGSVTVDHTTQLVDETVHVSWKGFKPSSGSVVIPGNTEYVVRVYECRGSKPAGPQDCYGSSVYTYTGQTDKTQNRPDGPPNYLDATTAKDGTGAVDVEVRTSRESSTLGCSATSACSLVVVPNYGDPTQPKSDFIYATNLYMDSTWAFANSVTVPISFAPSGAVCPLGDAGVALVGAPADQRAIAAWQPQACQGSNAVNIDYTAVGETQARLQFAAGRAEVALTTLPMTDATKPFAYAPLAVAGIAVAFHVDDAVTGQPIESMTLNARLVAKLLTQSYGGVGYTAKGAPIGSGNPAVAGNAQSIWTDPEFLALNKGHAWLNNLANPLLVSGQTDLVEELTRWVASDQDATAFLAGTPDRWGMHVNKNYKGITYPTDSIELRDPYQPLSYTFVPINGLDLVARSLVANQPSSYNPQPVPPTNNHPKDPQQLPGRRSLIAIVGTADAAAFNFPVAALHTAAGSNVTPTDAAMAAAVAGMTTNKDGVTQQADLKSTDKAAYPLTLPEYAVIPTSGVTAAGITQLSRFLAYASGPGQVPGLAPGQLPPGYLPLDKAQLAQVAVAEAAMRTQSGAKPTPKPAAAPSSAPAGGTPAGAATAGAGGAASSAPAVASSRAAAAPATTGARSARRSGVASPAPRPSPLVLRAARTEPASGTSSALLLLLVVGAVATVAGPALLLAGRLGAVGFVRRNTAAAWRSLPLPRRRG